MEDLKEMSNVDLIDLLFCWYLGFGKDREATMDAILEELSERGFSQDEFNEAAIEWEEELNEK